jgi:hypothetical protein
MEELLQKQFDQLILAVKEAVSSGDKPSLGAAFVHFRSELVDIEKMAYNELRREQELREEIRRLEDDGGTV